MAFHHISATTLIHLLLVFIISSYHDLTFFVRVVGYPILQQQQRQQRQQQRCCSRAMAAASAASTAVRVSNKKKTLSSFSSQYPIHLTAENDSIQPRRQENEEEEHQQLQQQQLPLLSRRKWIIVSGSSLIGLSSGIIQTTFAQPQIIASAAATTTTTTIPTSPSPPLTAESVNTLMARIERSFLRPKPIPILRPRLNLDFAIMLMRSSYNAVDTLDIVPMDQFQKDFFFIRQAEYLPYINSLTGGGGGTSSSSQLLVVQQGDLSDPNYFDFISFAQYATIVRVMEHPYSIFEEQQPVVVVAEETEESSSSSSNSSSSASAVLVREDQESQQQQQQRFRTVVVKRNSEMYPTYDLPRKFDEIVGNVILDKLIDTFGKTASAIPEEIIQPGSSSSSRPQVAHVLAAIQQMVNVFVVSGFAWKGEVRVVSSSVVPTRMPSTTSLSGERDDDDATGTQFTIVLTSPATLWSGSSLEAKKKSRWSFGGGGNGSSALLTNDFALKTVKAMMSRAGYKVIRDSVKYENYQEITSFSLL